MGKLFSVAAGPGGRVVELEEHFAGFGDHQHAFVFAIGEVFRANALWIAVAEIDFAADGFRDGRGEGDLHAAVFHAVFIRADAADVRGMCDHAPGIVLKFVPLLQEIIPAMVTEFGDDLAVHDGNFVDVRGVNDEFAAVGDNRLELVHAFAGDPDFVIHGRGAGQDGFEGFGAARDVDLTREFAGLVPGGFGCAGKKAGEGFVGSDNHREAKFVDFDHRSGAVHDFADGGPLVADDHRVGAHGAEPMEEVQNLRAANAGEQIFIAAGEADDFVRENRAADDDLVVIVNELVDLDGDVHGEQAAGQITDVLRRNRADVFQRGRVVPFVIVEL